MAVLVHICPVCQRCTITGPYCALHRKKTMSEVSVHPKHYEDGDKITATVELERVSGHYIGVPYWRVGFDSYTGEGLTDVKVVESSLEDGIYSSGPNWIFIVKDQKYAALRGPSGNWASNIAFPSYSAMKISEMKKEIRKNLVKISD